MASWGSAVRDHSCWAASEPCSSFVPLASPAATTAQHSPSCNYSRLCRCPRRDWPR